MKIKHMKGTVRVSELQTSPYCVPEWEFPILQAVHGPEAMTQDGGAVIEKKNLSAEGEYERLERRYKYSEDENGNRGPPYVAAVYGQFATGISNLRRAMEAATVADAPVDDLIGAISAGG
jgi:hypothetical protein